ncbi:MAG: glycine reductase, partial [Chloroflexi bacterium]|nr:glycine reductase [Chloroflexota bacterium]
ALRYLLKGKNPENVEYLIGCGEESVGDRYNRAGGSLSKAMGEMAWCVNATGSDTKAFCTGPVHALTVASAFIASGTYKDVVVVAGGCMHKLGMKSRGHLAKDMPLVEDVMAGIAVRLGPDDGKNPVIRLDSIGRHIIAAAGTAQAIMQNIVAKPLDRLGFKMTEIDKYATELHNPECTEPAGSGNVPKTNYRTLASFAVLRKDIEAKDLDKFATQKGMPGFSPTQGHIASAVPYLGFARDKMLKGEMQRSMFFAKGSLFLGRMTQLSDGISFILERNDRRGA